MKKNEKEKEPEKEKLKSTNSPNTDKSDEEYHDSFDQHEFDEPMETDSKP